METKQRTVRVHARKPIVHERVKTAESAEVLNLFNDFVREARKEMRKRERLTVKGMLSRTDCDSVTFLGDSFSLTIDFTGGIAI